MRRQAVLLLAAFAAVAVAKAQTFNLFAAASLKESATEIAHAFEKLHPGLKVEINFGGSQQLAAQIRQGAPVDVLLSAGMEPLKSIGYAKNSLEVFATNKLALVVPKGSDRVKSLADLNRGVRLIVADDHVPVGHYTHLMLEKASHDYGYDWVIHVDRDTVSREQDVRAVLAKIELGEADAGIVYATDFLAAKGKVQAVPIPGKYNVQATYPAVLFSGSPNPGLAIGFMRFLLGPYAQGILKRHGFDSPEARPK